MFMPTSEDARVPESAMVAFCTTLNTPVVNVDGLATGPARAGILLSAGEYGDLELWVRVCLISSDEGLTFKFQGDPTELGDHAAALDAALSFSEGMGFLFEEDMIGGAGAAAAGRAHRVWGSLFEAEDGAGFEPMGEAPTHDVSGEADAPILELEVADADEAPDPATAPPSTPTPATPQATGAEVLTKFRKAEPAVNAPPSERKPGAEELARIELASEELGEEYVDHAGFLSRLLGSF